MIALVDTNVILDVMLDRQPFATHSQKVVAAVETEHCQGLLCATTVTTIHYIARRQIGEQASLLRMADLMSLFGIAAVNRAVLADAIQASFADFEDAVLHEAAAQAGATCIVTRNVKDFAKARLPVYSPAQFLKALKG